LLAWLSLRRLQLRRSTWPKHPERKQKEAPGDPGRGTDSIAGVAGLGNYRQICPLAARISRPFFLLALLLDIDS